jgi:hypothetical protein
MYCCHNYLHSLCGLPYSSRSWHCLPLLGSIVCNVYSSQSLDLIPSQLSPAHTPYLSHIDFNIVPRNISAYFTTEIPYEKCVKAHTICCDTLFIHTYTICESLISLPHSWWWPEVLAPKNKKIIAATFCTQREAKCLCTWATGAQTLCWQWEAPRIK